MTVSYVFCKRFLEELTIKIFEHILIKTLDYRILDTSANKKKFQKEQICCHESEKAGKMELGELHFFADIYFTAKIVKGPLLSLAESRGPLTD